MSQLPVPVSQPFGAGLSATVSSAASAYLDAGLHGTDNTRRAYLSDLRGFDQFCAERNYCPRPAHLAGPPRKFATLKRHLAAIQKNHQLCG